MAVSRSVPLASDQRWPLARDGLAVVAVGLGLFLLVVLVLPAEGRLATALREAQVYLLGASAFVLPIALVLAGVVALARSLAPDAALPYSRLVGLSILAAAALPIRHLFAAESGGMIGSVFGNLLLDLIGGPPAVFVLALALVAGVLLTFDVRRWSGRAAG